MIPLRFLFDIAAIRNRMGEREGKESVAGELEGGEGQFRRKTSGVRRLAALCAFDEAFRGLT